MRDPQALPSQEYKDFSRRVHERAARTRRVIKAQLELTYRCNLHCRHCYTDPYNHRDWFPRELTLLEIERLLEEMATLGILWLNLTGGEIFTHPRFWDIYEDAYHKGFLLQLYTNGTLFTPATIERLRQRPPFSIDISCHSVNEFAFDRFTQVPGSFRAFMKGIALLKDSGLPFTLRTKAMTWNKDELPVIRQFVESLGLRFVFTTALSPRLNGDLSPLEFRLAPEDVAALEHADDRTCDGDELCSTSADLSAPPTDRLYRCGCGTDAIHINAWGELGACTMEYEHRVSLREYPLRDAIDKVFAAIHASRYHESSPCFTCQVFAFCEKKPSEARRECGRAEAPIPYDCDVALARAERTLGRTLIQPLRREERRERSPVTR
ncbi:MAG TPA: radical SAM protein [Nitrospiraceae bacterium]|jgi:MoaA/NifB/PqqE/SkfB family radical SAM enzyme|nr:radical SAM protein [Nitrospiraceae bacterium]